MAKKRPYVSKLKMMLPERSMTEWADQLTEFEAEELLSYIFTLTVQRCLTD